MMQKGFCLLLVLCGCADNRPVQQIPATIPVTIKEIPVPALDHADLSGIVKTEVATSADSIQQNTQSLVSASIGKVAEKIDAALVRIEANVNTRIEAQLTATANLKADLESTISLSNKIETQASAVAQLKSQIETRLDAMGAAQGAAILGLGNKLTETVQKYSAGHDVNSTQFTSEMADTFQKAFGSMVTVVSIVVSGLVMILGGLGWYVTRQRHNALMKVIQPHGK
jgi:hypothetical protein